MEGGLLAIIAGFGRDLHHLFLSHGTDSSYLVKCKRIIKHGRIFLKLSQMYLQNSGAYGTVLLRFRKKRLSDFAFFSSIDDVIH
jgi:hypothetical protein